MEFLEIILLVIAYTVMILTLFVEIICYKRNLEILETIHLTIALILLIMAITLSHLLNPTNSPHFTDIFLFESMVLAGLTTPLNVFAERVYQLKPWVKKTLVALSVGLMLLIPIGYFSTKWEWVNYSITLFLIVSIAASMLIIKTTRPKVHIAHREKIERYFANACLVIIPLSFVANYVADTRQLYIKIGFTIPLIFILMAASKLWDDVQRLALFKPVNQVSPQIFSSYALTKREQEVTTLLLKGHTYKQIAEQLFVSIPTVKTHTYNIYKKCKVHSRIELVTLFN